VFVANIDTTRQIPRQIRRRGHRRQIFRGGTAGAALFGGLIGVAA